MRSTFYTIWLPISLFAHIALLSIFAFAVKIEHKPAIDGIAHRVRVYTAPPPPPPIPENTEATPIKIEKPTPQPNTNRTDRQVKQKGSPEARTTDPTKNSGAGPADNRSTTAGASGPGTSPNSGAAPKIATGTNTRRVPQDDRGGYGYGGGNPEDIPGGGQGGGITQGAEATRLASPSIPKDSANTNSRSTVIVRLNIGTDGKITGAPIIINSSGNSGIDNAALSAARASTFKAKIVNGKAVASVATITYNFNNGALVGSPAFATN